ncbi:MAG: aminotransferase class V-fold PLP-dependent enzyme [Enterobacterales bacterium]|nr:aminotransferase class V-fold PLP-dependent enzyme [Enterobacterales bacterium]
MSKDLFEEMLNQRTDKKLFNTANRAGQTYLDEITQREVYPTDDAVAALEVFTEPLADHGTTAEDVLEMLHIVGSAATVATQSGRYFGFVTGGALPVSLAARILGDYWDQNPALYVCSPTIATLESTCEAWLRDLLKLPQNVVAGFVTGSSVAIFCGLAAGRYRLLNNLGWDVSQKGLYAAPRLRVIAPKVVHGTVLKAVSLLGLGHDSIEWLECDSEGRVLTEQLPIFDQHCLIILQAGNVCSGCYDDFQAIIPIAKAAGAWVHVDGAFGLWAAASETLQPLTAGMAEADSFSMDGHKSLNLPYDNGIVLCADKEALLVAMHNSGSYAEPSNDRDSMLYGPEMSRRGRAVDLWAALKYLGKEGVATLILRLHTTAVTIAEGLRSRGFSVVNDVVFNQVLVACDYDELTEMTLDHLQSSGDVWLGGALWNDQKVMRISVCSWMTTQADIEITLNAFVEALDKASQ